MADHGTRPVTKRDRDIAIKRELINTRSPITFTPGMRRALANPNRGTVFDIHVSPYWKGVAASLGALLITVQSVVSDDVVTSNEWGVIATAVGTAFAVVAKRNGPKPQP